MTEKKLQKALQGQTSLAKKVYGSVPKQDIWLSNKVLADLKRQGSSMTGKTVEACLRTLEKSGLIKESRLGWQQVKVSRMPVMGDTPDAAVFVPASVKVTKEGQTEARRSPIDILGEVGSMAKILLAAVEEAALEIEEYIEGVEENSKKLRQLQQLLRSLD